MLKRHVPGGMHPPFSKDSHGVEVPPGARLLTIAGQLGVTETGEIAQGASEQARLAFENMGKVLAAAGMGFEDIVHLNTYVTDRAHIEGYRAARADFMPDPPPSSTLLIISGLANPDFKIEIEAIAAKAD
jgi:enamine deaminase RidA (YjgF/YER057c/UK114 family)